MAKLTVKQQELINLIQNKQKELNEKIYVVYNNYCGMCLVKIVKDLKYEILVNKINYKVVNSLLDKGILGEEKINEQIKLVTLKN